MGDRRGRGGRPRTGTDASAARGAGASARVSTIDGRAMAVAVGVPLLAAAAILGVNAWLGDRLGGEIAVHWDGSGQPDGWGSRAGHVTTTVLVGALVPFAVMVAAGSARTWTALRRGLLGVGTWMAVLVGWLGVETLLAQADGAAGEISSATVWIGLAGVPLGLVAARVPRDLVPPVLATDPPPAHLPRSAADGVPAHRIGRVATLAVADDVLTVQWWRWTVLRIPVTEVTGAHVMVTSAWDWGGWGLRHQPGTDRYAYLGSGREGVELHRADGTRWLVTTPRADEVAGVVNAIADQRR